MFETALATKVVWCILPTVNALIKSLIFFISGLKTMSVIFFFFLVKVKSQGHGVNWCGFTFFSISWLFLKIETWNLKYRYIKGLSKIEYFKFLISFSLHFYECSKFARKRKIFNYPKMTSYFTEDDVILPVWRHLWGHRPEWNKLLLDVLRPILREIWSFEISLYITL